MARGPFDSSKDNLVHTVGSFDSGDRILTISIHSYDGGRLKIQTSTNKTWTNRSGEEFKSKVGRLSADEAMGLIPIYEAAAMWITEKNAPKTRY